MLCDFPTEIDDGVCWVANVLEELSKAAGSPSTRRAHLQWICHFQSKRADKQSGGPGERQAIGG